MLLLKIKNSKIVLAILLLLMSICLTENVAFSKEENVPNLYQAISKLMGSSSKENKHLLDGWNDYLIKITDHSNAEHLKVIEDLTIDFAKSINAHNKKIEKYREQDKSQYTSKWLDELAAQFGKDFVCNNKMIIIQNMIVACHRSDAKRYDRDAKDIVIKELKLYFAYESYLGIFMNYYRRLNKKDQEKMKAWKDVAEKYLSTYNKSHFAVIYYLKHDDFILRDNAMQKENIELYRYFQKTTLPFGNVAIMKANDDLNMFIEGCKTQSLKRSKN